MLVTSFGTRDGVYDAFVERLRESCDRHGIRHELELIPPMPRREALRSKPSHILGKMTQHPDEVVVWLDADAIVLGPFEVAGDSGWDIGLMPNERRHARWLLPVASYVVAVAPTPAARRFVEAWVHICGWEGSDHGDHTRLVATRVVQHTQYVEFDVSGMMARKIARDWGGKKQAVAGKESPLEQLRTRIGKRLLRQR